MEHSTSPAAEPSKGIASPVSIAPNPTPSSGSVSSADIDAYLLAHNKMRAMHGAAPLTWSSDLSGTAQGWANNCVFKHSHGQYGENLAAGTGLTIPDAIKMWTDESRGYNASNPEFSHFTQVVWKATTQLGCAVQACASLDGLQGNPGNFYVCEYNPPGNVDGEFAQNVQV
ncbi:PR-1-like protein [Lactifluus subvellereus]|nr:PR-1-like protein [Lactifluus subvellereus]